MIVKLKFNDGFEQSFDMTEKEFEKLKIINTKMSNELTASEKKSYIMNEIKSIEFNDIYVLPKRLE